MAQDDPVVSAEWLHQHLGAPDVKVTKKFDSSTLRVPLLSIQTFRDAVASFRYYIVAF
jgi:hypothetical protein